MALTMIILVIAGLFTMHTIGHLGIHDAIPATHQAHKTAPDPAAAPVSNDPGFPIAPLALCVAVLLAMITLAFGIALLARLTPRDLLRKLGGDGVLTAGRGPPAPRIGLRIADLSVLRT